MSDDLISREALKERVKNEVCEVCFTSPDERQCSPNCKLCTFNELIDNAPAVEARPRGEWIPMSTDCRGYSESFKCSICGAYIYPRCLEKELDYNFCPYCGADMGDEE